MNYQYKGFTYNYLFDYYPNKKVEDSLDPNAIRNRDLIFKFKKGFSNVELYNLIVRVLIYVYKESLTNYTLCIVPASNSVDNYKRYSGFCNYITSKTGMINGFEYIISSKDQMSSHNSKRKYSGLQQLIINKNVKNCNIILFDDIITSGKSFNGIAVSLLLRGANEVQGFFLGQTVNRKSKDWSHQVTKGLTKYIYN